MHANIITWQIDPSIRDPETYHAYVRSVFDAAVRILWPLGLIDLYVIRTERETMCTIAVYESAEAAAAGLRQIGRSLRGVLSNGITVREIANGPATHFPWFGEDQPN